MKNRASEFINATQRAKNDKKTFLNLKFARLGGNCKQMLAANTLMSPHARIFKTPVSRLCVHERGSGCVRILIKSKFNLARRVVMVAGAAQHNQFCAVVPNL